jgi:hypothetical protein
MRNGHDAPNWQIHVQNKVVSKDPWLTRSPDLTLPDFILWGQLKGKVCTKKPPTKDNIKGDIHQEIATIPADMLQDVFTQVSRFIKIYQ